MDPKEFVTYELKYGGPQRLSFSFKLGQALDNHLFYESTHHGVSKSAIVKHALHEYFEKRGRSSITP